MVGPFWIPTEGHKEAQTYSSSSMTAVYHCAQRSGSGVARQSPWLLSQHAGLFDILSHKNSPSALKEERGHPLFHAILNFLSVAAYARKDNPPRMQAVPQARLPTCGQLQRSKAWLPKLQAAAGSRSHLPVLLPKEDYKLKSNFLNL